jgi:RNA polymerase sigma-70 factor (ECF subfamily)
MALAPRARNKPNREWTAGETRESQSAPRPLPEGAALRREDLLLVRDFDALYALYGKQIFNSIYQRIGDYEEAADLTQETFLSAHKARDQFRGDSKVYTWLYRIAQNHCKNRFKQRDRQHEIEGPSLDAGIGGSEVGFDDTAAPREIADWTQSPAPLLEQKELQAQINRAVDSLQPAYKDILILRDVDGLSYNEIAEVTGLTLEAVKTRLNRARTMVRQKVEPYLKT